MSSSYPGITKPAVSSKAVKCVVSPPVYNISSRPGGAWFEKVHKMPSTSEPPVVKKIIPERYSQSSSSTHVSRAKGSASSSLDGCVSLHRCV